MFVGPKYCLTSYFPILHLGELQTTYKCLTPNIDNDTWISNAVRNIDENEIQLRNCDQLQHVRREIKQLPESVYRKQTDEVRAKYIF